MTNSTDGRPSFAPGLSDSNCENNASTNPANPTWGPFARHLPDAMLACLEADIQTRNRQSCRAVRKRGRFPCTLGCDALLRSHQDRKRHEEAIYPTEYWICYICVQPHQSRLMKGQFFHRLDKMRAHCTTHQAKNHGGRLLNLDHCKVLGFTTPSPSYCKLCQHPYASQHDRETHPLQRHTVPASAQPSQSNTIEWVHKLQRNKSEYSMQSRSDRGLLQAPINCELQMPATDKLVLDFQFLGTQISSHLDSMPFAQNAIKWLGKVSDKGGTAKVFKVELAFDMIRRCLSQPKLYAVKQFPNGYHHIFRHEVQMYATASAHNLHGITKCYGSFECIDSAGLLTYNILLELADGGDLMDYWLQTRPPRDFDGIETYYAAIFEIASTVRDLHNCTSIIQHPVSNQSRVRNLRHGDLKPENILRFETSSKTTEFNWMPTLPINKRLKFKLIDTGYDERLDYGMRSNAKCGTRRYRPPSRPSGLVWREQRADIWALGMTFSFAATWATLGSVGLRTFEACRRSALKGSAFASDLPFHDGIRLLPEVIRWHQHLKRHKHPHDTITAPLLDLLELRLLEPDPALRADANELCEQLRCLLDIAKNDHQILRLTSFVEDSVYHLHHGQLEGTVDLPAVSAKDFATEDPQIGPDFFDSGVFVDTSEGLDSSSMDPCLYYPSQSAWEVTDTWAIAQGEDE